MIGGAPPLPIPKETVRLNIDGTPLDPTQTAQVASVPPPQSSQNAEPGQTNQAAVQGAAGGSAPRMMTPPQI